MSRRIKGITIEIDGDTKGLDKALKDVNKESRDIQRELRDVDRLLRFNPKNTELLAQKKKLLAQQVEVTRKRLDKLKGAQEQVTEAFKKGEISEEQYRAFQREIVETESKLKHYENQLKQVDKTHRSFGEKVAAAGKTVKELGQSMTNVGKELSMKVTAPLMAIGGVATKIGMDFKAGLSEVQALSGATGAELQELETRARELGASTKFSAKEVTEGFKYMSLAGWDVQQSLDGIDGVLDLAAASGEDLARVSDILTDAISAFGDEAKDASRYADVLATASSNANTDVAGLGEAFKMVAPVAGALNYSLEDTAVALGLMANAGVKGSAAGTALRSALTNLVKPTAAMEKEMKKLGIEVKDSEGNMKPLDALLRDMRKSFANLSEDQKANAAATIFGKEAMSGMLAVLNASESDFNKLTKAIENSEGVAKEMADTMQNNLQGKLTNLKSALEELAIKIFDALEPALTWLVDIIQSVVDWFNGLGKGAQTAIVAISGIAAAIGPLLVAGGTLLTLVGGFMTVLPTLLPMLTALIGPIGIVAGALVGLGIAFELSRAKADGMYKEQRKLAESNYELTQAYSELLDEKEEQIDKTTELINTTKEQMETVDGLVDTYENLTEKSKLTTDEFGEFLTLQSELENTKSPERIAEIEERMEELRQKSGLSKEEFNKLLESNEALAEQFPEAGKVIDEYGNVIMDTTGKLRDMTQAELERMQLEIYNQMIEDLRTVNAEVEQYESLLGEIVELEDNIASNKQEVADIQEQIKNNEQTIAENNEILAELKERQKEASLTEWWQLDGQINSLQAQNYELENKNKKHQKNLDVLEETLATNEKDLKQKEEQREKIGGLIDKNRENYQLYTEILGKQFNINIKKGEEVKSIDEAIKKRQDEITRLESLIKKEGDSNGKKQEAIDRLKEENRQLNDAKTKLGDMNKSLDTQTGKYDKANNNLAKVNGQFQKAGGLTDNNIKKADLWNQKLDKKHNKKVNIEQSKDPDKENKKWGKRIRKTIDVVTSGLSKLKFWAEGTNYHPGGPAVLGEEGPELVRTGNKLSLASFGLYDLPKGSKVYTAQETANILRSGLVSGIGKGLQLQQLPNQNLSVIDRKNNNAILQQLQAQNRLLRALLNKEQDIYIDGRSVSKVLYEDIDQMIGRRDDLRARFRT